MADKYGRTGDVMKWKEQLNGDCPKRDGRLNDRCDIVMPDLPKVLKVNGLDSGAAWSSSLYRPSSAIKAPRGTGFARRGAGSRGFW